MYLYKILYHRFLVDKLPKNNNAGTIQFLEILHMTNTKVKHTLIVTTVRAKLNLTNKKILVGFFY